MKQLFAIAFQHSFSQSGSSLSALMTLFTTWEFVILFGFQFSIKLNLFPWNILYIAISESRTIRFGRYCADNASNGTSPWY